MMAKITWKGIDIKEATALTFKILKLVMPVSGVGMVSTMCLFLALVYYWFLLPYQLFTYPILLTLILFLIAHWILVNTLYNYILAILIHPGKSKGSGPSKCRQCRTNRPERSHHCKTCGYCVLLMDHHCLWINNCVGYYNYGYFMKACIYAWLGAAYGTLTLLPEVFAFSDEKSVIFLYQDLPNLCIIAWCICLAVLVGFTIMNGWFLYLISLGMTSIEYKQLSAWKTGVVSPYSRGSWANIAFALGVRDGRWSMLLRPCYFVPYNYWSTVDLEAVETQY